MEFPHIPAPVCWFMTAALFLGVVILLASPFVAGWWLWHHVTFK